MKRLSRCFPLTVAGFILFFTLSSWSLATEYVSVKKDGVNIRSGPATDKAVVMEVFRGFPLKVVEKKGNWLKVSDYENDSGWINKDMTENTKTVIVVAKTSANMRQEPNNKGAKIADVEPGVVLQLLKEQGEWRQVKHSGGTTGWLHKTLIWPQ